MSHCLNKAMLVVLPFLLRCSDVLFPRAGCSTTLTLRRPIASRIARTTAVTTSRITPLCAGACLGRWPLGKGCFFHGKSLANLRDKVYEYTFQMFCYCNKMSVFFAFSHQRWGDITSVGEYTMSSDKFNTQGISGLVVGCVSWRTSGVSDVLMGK